MPRPVLIAISVLLVASFLSARPAVTPPTFGRSASTVNALVTATNGATFFAAWTMLSGSGSHAYGSIVSATGEVLTPVAFLIAPDSSVLAAASDGSDYVLVVAGTGSNSGRLSLVSVANSGEVKASREIPVFGGGSTAAVFNDSGLLLITTSSSFPPQTTMQFLSRDGASIRGSVFFGSSRVTANAAGNNFVVATLETNAFFIARFDSSGRSIQSNRIQTALAPGNILALGASETQTAIVWHDAFGAVPLRLTIATQNGTFERQVLEVAPLLMRATLLWTGVKYVLIGETASGVVVAHGISADGRSVDSGVTISGGASAAMARGVIFVAGAASDYQTVYASVLQDDAARLQTIAMPVLSITLRRQSFPRMASDGFNAVATWWDRTADANVQAAIRLSLNGIALDGVQTDLGSAVPVIRDYDLRSVAQSSIAFGKSVYLAVWRQDKNVVASRIAPTGALIDATPLILAPVTQYGVGVSDQAIAWDGTRFFIAWQSGTGVRGAFVSEQGEVSPSVSLSDTGWDDARIVWNGSRFVLTFPLYTYGPVHGFVAIGIGIARFAADATPLDPTSYQTVARIDLPFDQYNPSVAEFYWHVATNGGDVVVVFNWQSANDSTQLVSVHTGAATLQIDKPLTLFEWALGPVSSDVIWSGESYIVSTRYGAARSTWLAAQYFVPGQGVVRSTVADTATPDGFGPAAMTAAQGRALFVFTEIEPRGSVGRLRSYAEEDMQPMPPRPAAPTLVMMTGSVTASVITWKTVDTDVAGFLVEAVDPQFGSPYQIAIVGPNDRSIHTSSVRLVRLRAFNRGGFSDPSPTVGFSATRRQRSVH